MPRVIVTTCGTSLLTSNCWEEISYTPAISKLESPDKEEMEKKYRAYIKAYNKELPSKFDLNVWKDTAQLSKLPAELASLKAMDLYLQNKISKPFTEDDESILLHADNDDAIFCANVIHQTIKEKLIPETLLKVKLRDLYKIHDLDPAKAGKSQKAYDRLWGDLADKFPYKENVKYYFNLTGGYKSVVILLSCFAYAKGVTDTNIFYLNEEAGDNLHIMNFNSGEIYKNILSTMKTDYYEPSTGNTGGSIMPQEF